MTSFDCSVVIPARDALPDVLDAVDSALAQTLKAREVLVVDDGSSDGTGEAVRARFGDRVRVISGRFGGAAAARNTGWRAATGTWMAFLDADDLWFPDKLAITAECLERHPDAAWFFSDGAFRTLDGDWHDSWLATYADLPADWVGRPVAQLIEVNFVLTSSVVARRDALEALNGFDESLSHAEDLDLWIRLARRWPAAASRRPLVRYQHRAGGLTRQIEARLGGDVALFRRLSQDRDLARGLRRRARRREAMAHLKLALVDLRENRRAKARAHLVRAWLFPEQAAPVAAAFAISLLPAAAWSRLRRDRWAKHGVAAPMLRARRVSLTSAGGMEERR